MPTPMTHTDNTTFPSVVSSTPDDLPSFYRNRMNQVPLLTHEEEVEIFQLLEHLENELRELQGHPGRMPWIFAVW